MEILHLKLNQVLNLQFSLTVFHPFLSFHGSLDFRHAGLPWIAWNPVNQEKPNLDGRLGLRIGDSLIGSVEDAASSPIVPKKYSTIYNKTDIFGNVYVMLSIRCRQLSDIRHVVVWQILGGFHAVVRNIIYIIQKTQIW